MAKHKLKEVLDIMINEEQERKHVFIGEMIIKKHLNQCIPYTAEEWEEYKRDKADRDNKQLTNYIDKVFYEDGALN